MKRRRSDSALETVADDGESSDDARAETYAGARDGRGRAHGFGRATYADGSAYEGEFRGGRRHGRGTLTVASGGTHDGEWARGRAHGFGRQVSSDGCALECGNFEHGVARGECRCTYSDGTTTRYEGELSERDGSWEGVGTLCDVDAGWRLSGSWFGGELGRGVCVWQERADGADAVVGWSRASFGATRTRRARADVFVESAIVVRLSDEAATRPRELVRALNALALEPGTSLWEAVASGGVRGVVARVLDAHRALDAGVLLERHFESARVISRGTSVCAARSLETGDVVAFYSGTPLTVGGVSTLEAERIASGAVMLREFDEDEECDVVAAHDEDAPYARSRPVRALELDASTESLAANAVRVETKVETNCERVYAENHPLLGETVFLRASRPIAVGEECTVAPDYFFGWCLDPKSEAGYYSSMKSHPPRVIFRKENDFPGLGRVSVKQHGRWRAIYLDKVEQGLSYERFPGEPAADTRVLGFQYIRVMSRAAMRYLSRAARPDSRVRVVAVGLGSGALPLYLANARSLRNQLDVLVIEQSRAVIDACVSIGVPIRRVKSMIEHETAASKSASDVRSIDVLRCDAFDFFRETSGAAVKCVLLDAYDGQGRIPAHIRSADFIHLLGLSLTEGGFCVCNCWDGKTGSKTARELAIFANLLSRHVGDVERFSVIGETYNVVLVATKRRPS